MLIYWFLPMILFLGLVTSYEDIKMGKIRNKWIILSMFYALTTYFYIYFFNNMYLLNIVFIYSLILNSMLALLTGVLLWNYGFWSAGDAKLFFSFILLIPLFGRDGYFFFVSLFLYTFAPLSLYFIAHLLIKMKYKESLPQFRKELSLKPLLQLILFVFGVSWIVRLILSAFGLETNIALFVFSMLLIFYLNERTLKINMLYIGAALSLARLFLDSSIFTAQFLSLFLIILLILILMKIVVVLSRNYFTRELRINQLQAGMIPAEIFYKIGNRFYRKPIKSSQKKKKGKLLFRKFSYGLSEVEILNLKKLQKRLPFKTLRVHLTVPFAPFIFLGAILMIIIHGFAV
jgi:hypothetical protein